MARTLLYPSDVELLSTIALVALAAVGLLAALLVLVPIQVVARGIFTDARVDANASAAWGYGFATLDATPRGGAIKLLGFRVYRFDGWASKPSTKPPKDKQAKPRRSGRRPSLRFIGRVLRRVVASLQPGARLSGRLGTGDPADTAKAYGVLYACRRLLPGVDTRGLTLDWVEPALDLHGDIEGRIWPAAILWIVVSEFVKSRQRRRKTWRILA